MLYIYIYLSIHGLKPKSANFLPKGLDSKYFRFCRSHDLCCNFLNLLLSHACGHRQYMNR